ncbi:MAG: hypothetical protein J5803_04825 [Desulfovibrio sp.]|nr:hypothetical protein [Desulfovibrio sp.]
MVFLVLLVLFLTSILALLFLIEKKDTKNSLLTLLLHKNGAFYEHASLFPLFFSLTRSHAAEKKQGGASKTEERRLLATEKGHALCALLTKSAIPLVLFLLFLLLCKKTSTALYAYLP